ncbi:MAG: carbon-nitrogen hydrolase [Gemmatimonadota bacterium]
MATPPRPPSKTILGLVQMRMTDDPADNLARAVAGIRQAASRGANIICLPELFLGPYFCQVEDHRFFKLAEAIPGPTTARLSPIARELGVVLIASLFEKRAEGLYHNTTAVIDSDGQYLGKYRKMHIPDDPQFYEKFYFTPGDLGFRTWETKQGKAGVLICWDQWYPEAARLTALSGSQILFYPTAIGWLPAEKAEYGVAQQNAWETMQRSHAIANGVYVAAVNRVGLETTEGGAGIEFWGGSFVCDPSGNVLARAGTGEEILVVPCDMDKVDFARTHWPFLRDRRVDAYGDMPKRFID